MSDTFHSRSQIFWNKNRFHIISAYFYFVPVFLSSNVNDVLWSKWLFVFNKSLWMFCHQKPGSKLIKKKNNFVCKTIVQFKSVFWLYSVCLKMIQKRTCVVLVPTRSQSVWDQHSTAVITMPRDRFFFYFIRQIDVQSVLFWPKVDKVVLFFWPSMQRYRRLPTWFKIT